MTALVRERKPARNRTPVALAIVALALAGLALRLTLHYVQGFGSGQALACKQANGTKGGSI